MRATEVLLVDDNPADTDLTSEVLTQNVYPIRIRAVTDGVEAIAFLRGEGKHANHSEGRSMNRAKIMIVDDDPELRQALSLRLRANHYDTVNVCDG